MNIFNWLRPRQTVNAQLSSGYSFLFGPTSAGRAVNE